jgi:acyl carrier protein
MGLDGVELVIAVEEEFEMVLSDSEAEASMTVGSLVDLVYSRLRHKKEQPCPSQQGFYIVQKKLMDHLDLPRSAIKPETELNTLIPKLNRRRVWNALVKSLTDNKHKRPWPGLVRPRWMGNLVFLHLPGIIFVGTILTGFFIVRIPSHDFFLYLFFAIVPAIVFAIVGMILTTPFRTEFPPGISQVKDLIRFVKTLDSRIWSKEAVFEKIREITVEQLGVKPEQVIPEARWIEDLGVG